MDYRISTNELSLDAGKDEGNSRSPVPRRCFATREAPAPTERAAPIGSGGGAPIVVHLDQFRCIERPRRLLPARASCTPRTVKLRKYESHRARAPRRPRPAPGHPAPRVSGWERRGVERASGSGRHIPPSVSVRVLLLRQALQAVFSLCSAPSAHPSSIGALPFFDTGACRQPSPRSTSAVFPGPRGGWPLACGSDRPSRGAKL